MKPVRVLMLNLNSAARAWVERSLPGPDWKLRSGEDLHAGLEAVLAPGCEAILLGVSSQTSDTEPLYLDRRGALAMLEEARLRHGEIPLVALLDEADEAAELSAAGAGAADCAVLASEPDLPRLLRLACARQRSLSQLLQRSHYDALTGIPNRLLFRDRLTQALERCRRLERSLALLHIDLDGFGQVNKSFGHDAGDSLVRATAERLGLCVRRIDSLARIAGDEFTVTLEDIDGTRDITPVVKKIIDFLSRPFDLDGRQVALGCSIGIAVFPSGGDTLDQLLTHANMAMKQAKAHRGSDYRFYSEELHREARDRMQLEADLRRALRRGEFELHYQPRVELDSGNAVGMEALIRWRHPERGLLGPGQFIPLAEEIGLIVPIGYWTIHRACADLAELDARGVDQLDVAVNLSFRQLQDKDFIATITRILKQSTVDPARVEFEITETAVMSDFDRTYRGMQALTALGVSFALDDFGTGYSSFVHLQRLPISTLKLDRSFIQNVTDSDDDATIVRAMINLAHSLKLTVVAEGAETLAQVQFLWQHHCDQIQGWYFSTAVSVDEIEHMLNHRALAAL